jgi:hypothetical protein
MGAKYFKGRVHTNDRTYRYVVWDGEHDYESHPPVPELAIAEGLCGDLFIVQTHKRDWHKEDLAKLLVGGRDLVIWARDAATYRAIIKNLSAEGERLQ